MDKNSVEIESKLKGDKEVSLHNSELDDKVGNLPQETYADDIGHDEPMIWINEDNFEIESEDKLTANGKSSSISSGEGSFHTSNDNSEFVNDQSAREAEGFFTNNSERLKKDCVASPIYDDVDSVSSEHQTNFEEYIDLSVFDDRLPNYRNKYLTPDKIPHGVSPNNLPVKYRPRARASVIWTFYKSRNPTQVECLECHALVVRAAGHSTKSMWSHMKKHPEKLIEHSISLPDSIVAIAGEKSSDVLIQKLIAEKINGDVNGNISSPVKRRFAHFGSSQIQKPVSPDDDATGTVPQKVRRVVKLNQQNGKIEGIVDENSSTVMYSDSVEAFRKVTEETADKEPQGVWRSQRQRKKYSKWENEITGAEWRTLFSRRSTTFQQPSSFGHHSQSSKQQLLIVPKTEPADEQPEIESSFVTPLHQKIITPSTKSASKSKVPSAKQPAKSRSTRKAVLTNKIRNSFAVALPFGDKGAQQMTPVSGRVPSSIRPSGSNEEQCKQILVNISSLSTEELKRVVLQQSERNNALQRSISVLQAALLESRHQTEVLMHQNTEITLLLRESAHLLARNAATAEGHLSPPSSLTPIKNRTKKQPRKTILGHSKNNELFANNVQNEQKIEKEINLSTLENVKKFQPRLISSLLFEDQQESASFDGFAAEEKPAPQVSRRKKKNPRIYSATAELIAARKEENNDEDLFAN